jgi:SAM-dependent methyltransferase
MAAERFGVRRIAQAIVAAGLQNVGRLVIAERFAAARELAAIVLPAPPFDPKGGPVRLLLLNPRDGSLRTALLEGLGSADTLHLGFHAFANQAGATFLLFAFQPSFPGALRLRASRMRLAASSLTGRPPIALPCNEEVSGFQGLALPPHPPDAMHLLAIASASEPANVAAAGAIETCWQEGGGSYVQGWIHAYERRVLGAAVTGPAAPIAIDRFTPRPDLLVHFPMLPDGAGKAGFAIFVPGHQGAALSLSLETATGSAAIALPLPAPSLPSSERLARETMEKEQAFIRFVTEVNDRRLDVIEVGARPVGSRTEALRDRFPRARRYVGMDVHPGHTVDVLGDAHELSRLVGPRSFDAVFSGAVLEHLGMPWVVAAEINRVLRPGGLVYHIAPQAWPVHEEPNDFWRFTDEALKVLFGEPFGFEVLSAGMADRVRLYPLNKKNGDLGLPLGYGYGSAWVLARKTRDIDEADVRLAPLTPSLASLSRRYPRAGG